MKTVYLRSDSRNRVTLTKVIQEKTLLYRATVLKDKIILEPVKEEESPNLLLCNDIP